MSPVMSCTIQYLPAGALCDENARSIADDMAPLGLSSKSSCCEFRYLVVLGAGRRLPGPDSWAKLICRWADGKKHGDGFAGWNKQ